MFKNYLEEVRNASTRLKWDKTWSPGGCYIHLEVSEFIEALRGKGDPIEELGDVLCALFSVTAQYNLDITEAMEINIKKLKLLIEKKDS